VSSAARVRRLGRRLAPAALAALALAAASTAATAGGPIASASAFTVLPQADNSTPELQGDSTLPPPAHRLSSDAVIAIATRLPAIRAVAARHRGSYPVAYLKGPDRWQVSIFSRDGRTELGQVLIADRTGRVLEEWTGFQVAWTMARGYPGAFGRTVDAVWLWIPLLLLFCFPFVDWRRPRRLLHLDLLAVCSFSISLAFFNHADIGMSVPLVYPPLVYLLVRMLVIARPGRRGPAPAPTERLHLNLSPYWLLVAVIFLVGFRIALNVTDGNVIDVGYAGVIGAHRITHGESLYGNWPASNVRGDTYGPVSYEAYVPFVALFGWSGRWDDLPAAHAAAVFFDLLALGLCFLLGRRVRGPSLGVALAFTWAANPFTLFALESDTNDALVAALVLAAVLVATGRREREAARGALAALAGLTKFAPLALAPLLATHGLSGSLRQRALAVLRFSVAFAVCAALVSIPAFTHSTPYRFWEDTLVYQANRGSPFSVWGLYGGLGPL
jgi:Glycosyltransferase family 87